MKKLIMTDLDNTLLPIDQEMFVQLWFRDVSKKFFDYGLDPEKGVKAVEAGCVSMLKNHGERSNKNAFFRAAREASGYGKVTLKPLFDDYYENEFENIRSITEDNPLAQKAVQLMKEKSDFTAVATMPLFPLSACDMRMRWVGVNADMFDMVTSYDLSSYSKPNPFFFAEILKKFGVAPEDALMIGNDVKEDIRPCESLGIETFLVKDHLITHGIDPSPYRGGSFEEMIAFLETV